MFFFSYRSQLDGRNSVDGLPSSLTLGNIILICRLKIRDHGYQLPQKDQEMIQTASVKRSVALTEETQVEKALLFKVTEEAAKV